MKNKDVINGIWNNRDQLAFVLGNGINRYAYYKKEAEREHVAWDSLIKCIWKEYNPDSAEIPLPCDDNGISLTEIYDLIYIKDPSSAQYEIKNSTELA